MCALLNGHARSAVIKKRSKKKLSADLLISEAVQQILRELRAIYGASYEVLLENGNIILVPRNRSIVTQYEETKNRAGIEESLHDHLG